jgi:hypothetical protein
MNNTHQTLPTTAHTPETWHVHNHVHIHGPAGQPIATIQGNFGDAAKIANARRIVAAVNACQGIATESLEQGVVREFLTEIMRLLSNAEYADGQAIVLTQDCEALEAAIAMAKGQQP